MYTYRHSSDISPSDVFSAEMSIVWDITTDSNVGSGGTFPQVVTTSEHDVHVGEIQALVTG